MILQYVHDKEIVLVPTNANAIQIIFWNNVHHLHVMEFRKIIIQFVLGKHMVIVAIQMIVHAIADILVPNVKILTALEFLQVKLRECAQEMAPA